jgi:hypothetical protein
MKERLGWYILYRISNILSDWVVRLDYWLFKKWFFGD